MSSIACPSSPKADDLGPDVYSKIFLPQLLFPVEVTVTWKVRPGYDPPPRHTVRVTSYRHQKQNKNKDQNALKQLQTQVSDNWFSRCSELNPDHDKDTLLFVHVRSFLSHSHHQQRQKIGKCQLQYKQTKKPQPKQKKTSTTTQKSPKPLRDITLGWKHVTKTELWSVVS